jgi:dTDP-4-amino-4,6-dideoxygalactose transaminase
MKSDSFTSSVTMPPWDDVCHALADIFERRYYTENGPMVQTLEESIMRCTGMGQVVCISNGFVAALMLLNTLPDQGEVLLVGDELTWMEPVVAWFPGLTAVQCEKQGFALALTARTRVVIVQEQALAAGIKQACIDVARPDILVVLDASDTPLADADGGADVHLCRMRERDPLNAVDGAYIATHDLDLADMLRSMRSSSGVTRKVRVNKTVNGRLSEAHAAIGLLSLQRLKAVSGTH